MVKKKRFSDMEYLLVSCYHDAIVILVFFERICPKVIAIRGSSVKKIFALSLALAVHKRQKKIGKLAKILVRADIL